MRLWGVSSSRRGFGARNDGNERIDAPALKHTVLINRYFDVRLLHSVSDRNQGDSISWITHGTFAVLVCPVKIFDPVQESSPFSCNPTLFGGFGIISRMNLRLIAGSSGRGNSTTPFLTTARQKRLWSSGFPMASG